MKETLYPGNSHKEKEAENTQKARKVVTGKANRKPRSETSKVMRSFIAEDMHSIGIYILRDVLAPTIKNAISDIVSNGTNMLLYGEAGRRPRKQSNGSKISYRNYYPDPTGYKTKSGRITNDTYDYDEIEYETRGDAEDVLSQLCDIVDMYGKVSIADMYELSGMSSVSTDHNYGWTRMDTSKIIRKTGGYFIRLGTVRPLI